MPPHTPNSTRLSSASAPHSSMTGQCRQMTAALRCAAPRTNSSSGSAARHSALETQAILDSASAPKGMVAVGAAALVLRGAVRIPDTSDSPSLLPPVWRPLRDPETPMRPVPHCPRRCYLYLIVWISYVVRYQLRNILRPPFLGRPCSPIMKRPPEAAKKASNSGLSCG